MSTTTAVDPAGRRTSRLGGFSTTFVALEIRRMLRNKRTAIFTLIMPSVFFLLFGTDSSYKHTQIGRGNVTAYVLISMAVYGAMLATTSGGAAVSVERAVGWSRQLRLTPLNPVAYVAVKLVVAMTLGLVSVVVVFAVGSFFGPDHAWRCLARLRSARVGMRCRLRRVRALHGLSAAQRERHADPRPGARAAVLRRRAVRPARPDGPYLRDHRQVHPGLRRRGDRALPADERLAHSGSRSSTCCSGPLSS